MRARIVADEPIIGPHVWAKLMKRVTVKLSEDGWTKTVSFTVPAEEETLQEIDQAVRKFLRDNGKDETFDWA
jgi:hypothetical protein